MLRLLAARSATVQRSEQSRACDANVMLWGFTITSATTCPFLATLPQEYFVISMRNLANSCNRHSQLVGIWWRKTAYRGIESKVIVMSRSKSKLGGLESRTKTQNKETPTILLDDNKLLNNVDHETNDIDKWTVINRPNQIVKLRMRSKKSTRPNSLGHILSDRWLILLRIGCACSSS